MSLTRLAGLFLFALLSAGQSLNDIRAQGSEMLQLIRKTVEKDYFDPEFGGTDMKAAFDKAERSMQQAQSAGHTFGIIAQALTTLNDSHTFLIPPSRVAKVKYGWKVAVIGEQCLITAVKPGSDSASKGVKPGDEVLAIEGYAPNRSNLWKMRQMFYSLQPRPTMRLALRSSDGTAREIAVAASIQTGKQVVDLAGQNAEYDYYELLRQAMTEAAVDPHRTHRFGKELIIYHMPDFGIDVAEADNVMNRAREHERMIIDLRGNPGGNVETLERIAGHLLGKDVVLAERKGRKKEKPITSLAPGKPLAAKLVVLVDSESGSASEILARAVQLEKRGIVIGDRTAGAVRQSRQHSLQLGHDRVVMFGVSVTNSDLIMKDGKSLEHSGVIPDEILLPSPQALAAGADPVLARAAEFLGVKLSAEEAGKLFPVKWN